MKRRIIGGKSEVEEKRKAFMDKIREEEDDRK